ncbi:MAG TPA: SusD/RagB family nutrient-binding outer membrane lipoprotein [Puia sp.]|nr:SusD/RagB family nutrient-binding outer membrane lipoprotein [Puia sp.]
MKQKINSTGKKILSILMILTVLGSCTKNFKEINTPWNGSPSASVQQLYIAFVSNLFLTYGDQATMNSYWYPISQQGIVYTKPDYSYDGGPSDEWSNFYHNLSNYKAMMTTIAASHDSTIYTNVKAMMKTLRAYEAIKLSNFYGDMPYSLAGNAIDHQPADYSPPYDTQQSIYLSCLNDLAWAVNNFSSSDPKQLSLGSGDLVLQNDIDLWIKFANSLRLRLALTIFDKDATDATPQIADALSKPLLSDYTTDNVGLYPSNIPNLDLGAREFSFGQECRLRMGTTMWQWMSSTNAQDGSGIFDPRCNIFFEPNNAGKWNPFPQNPTSATTDGGDPYNHGIRDADWSNKNGNGNPPTVNNYADFNYYWGRDKNIPELFITAAEVHFLKAEAYARGAGVTADLATAQTEYYAGVTASVNFWTTQAINSVVWVVNKPTGLPDAPTMTAFLANPVVAFDPGNALKQIYGQEWIDMFRQPWEAWTLLRRTGGQTPMDPNNAAYYAQTYGDYQRVQYPSSEQTYNYKNWFAETNNSDLISKKIWIAK